MLFPHNCRHVVKQHHRSFIMVRPRRATKIQIELAAESVRRVIQETNEFVIGGRARAYDALALEDALRIEFTERGPLPWIKMMRQEANALMNMSGPALPQGLILVGPRGGGKQEAITRGLDATDMSVVMRTSFADFMATARANMFKNLSDPAITLRDPIPFFVRDMMETNVQILVLENVLVDSLFDAMLLRRMFFGLFSQGLGIIMSSPRPPRQWYSKGVHSEKFIGFVDLIERRCEVTRLDGSGLGKAQS